MKYAEREAERQNPKPKSAVLTSTRSTADEDAHRDYDGYDIEEDLARIRLAVKEITESPRSFSSYGPSLRFLVEAFENLDEYLVRGGPLPKSWAVRMQDEPGTDGGL